MPKSSMPDNSESVYLTYIAYLEVTRAEFHTLRCFILWRLSQFDFSTRIELFDVLNEVALRFRKVQEKQVYIEHRVAFLKSIALNFIREVSRKEKKASSCSPELIEATAVAVAVEVEDETIALEVGSFAHDQIRQAIQRLRPDQRALLNLRYVHGFSWRKISEVLEQKQGEKVSEAALRQRHQAAKIALRREILRIVNLSRADRIQ